MAVLGLGALALLGCGEAGLSRDQAIDSFQATNPEATDEQAACVVDGLIDRYGLAELETELSAEPLDASFEEAQFREMFGCDVAGEWRQQVSDQLVANGVAAEDAPCVSDELFATMTDDDIGVLLSGDITDSFNDTFFDALETCDALNG